jgi:NADH-quinone oxidoreductase subunit G
MADYAPVDLAADEQVTFELNGRQVSAPAGTMLVDAAYAHGVEIPIFCYEPRLGAAIGACRMCLVEVEGMRGLQTACSTPVAQDMVVRSNSDQAKDAHDGVLELILANHPLDCPVCDKGGECPLQDRTFKFGPPETRFIERKRHFPKPLDLSSLVALDRERCISCFRCVRFSQDVAQDGQLTFRERGGDSEITTFTGGAYEGRFTGNVIDICPVGALTSIPYRFVARPWDVVESDSVCAQCPVGCNTAQTTREGDVQRVNGRERPNWAVEEGWLCDKGRFAYPLAWSPDRLRTPLIRDGEQVREVSLEEAVEAAALLLRREGADPAVVVGGDATVEEAFLAQELAGALGGPVQGLTIPGRALAPLRALPSADLGDIDGAGLVVVVGGAPSDQQPVVELRLRKARRNGARVVVIGPRPHVLTGLGEWRRTDPGALAAGLGDLASELTDASSPVVLWDEADLAAEPDAAVALAEALTGVAGVRQIELGADVNGAGLRALGVPAEGVLARAHEGRVGTLVTVRADPLSAAGAASWDDAVPKLGAVIAIATHASELTEVANVVLPATTHYEHEGTLVAMNGRAQRLRPGPAPPEGTAAAWELLLAVMHRVGAPREYRTPSSVLSAAASARPGLAGLSYAAMGEEGVMLAPPEAPSPNGHGGRREPDGDGLLLLTTHAIFGDAASHRSDALAHVRQGASVTLAPADAAGAGLAAGARARITSPHGSCVLPVAVDPECPEGAALTTMGVPRAGAERLLAWDRSPVRVTVEPAGRV